jgi:sugar lactone lactonase YvrE
MIAPRVTCLVDAQDQVGEGVVWDGIDGVLWWTDIKGCRLHRLDAATGREETFQLGIRVGCFALRQGGGMILAAEHGFWAWDPATGRLDHLLDVEADRPDNRMNDGGCDRQGRLLASSMSLSSPRQPTGACWRLDADLRAELVTEGLTVGNGIAFSPKGDRFYLADTGALRVWAHDYDTTTGAVGPRRSFVDTTGLVGRPDGATVDAEGGYWLAGVSGGQVYRFAPDGRLDRTIDLPVTRPTRPMFGGAGLDRLYVTSIRVDGEPLSGGLFVIEDPGAVGLPEPRFAG